MKAMRVSALLARALAVIVGVFLASAVHAQSWPQRSVRFIVPLGPGSATDISARLAAERLQQRWGQPVDMVGPVLMLATQAGAFITGNVILADGGILCRTFD